MPIPYPNIAFSSDLAKGTTTVSADGGNMCAIYGSEFSKSTGDEPGTAGGVASGTFIKEATWITYSFDVKFEGEGACRLTDKMFHNHQNTVNIAGELQAALPSGRWDLQCVLDILCKSDKDVVKQARKLKIFSVDPLTFDDPIFSGGRWTTTPFHAGGIQNPEKMEIQIIRDMSCEGAAYTLYHEILHSQQPRDMSWRDKEIDAYTRTEQWAIDRGLPGNPALRIEFDPVRDVLSEPYKSYVRQSVDPAAVRAKVDLNYPITLPSTPGGAAPPQVVGRTTTGQTIVVDSSGNERTRPPIEGDRYPAANPRNPPNARQIPPRDLKCP